MGQSQNCQHYSKNMLTGAEHSDVLMFGEEPKWLMFQLEHELNMNSSDNVIRILNTHAQSRDRLAEIK